MNLSQDQIMYIGAVVDTNDPLKANRVRVRLFGLHDSPESDLKNEDLIWSFVLMPTTTSTVSGVGGLHGLQNTSIVVVYFLDGIDQQVPVVMGSIGGLQAQELPGLYKDSNGVLPLYDRTGEADTNRLARGEKTGTIVSKKSQVAGVNSVNGSWSMPAEPFASKYPFNNVEETLSGHIIEKDDTPGAERLMIWHKSGSYTEHQPDGSIVHRCTKSSSTHIVKDNNIYVEGNCNLTVKGNLTNKVYGNEDRHIIGNLNETIDGNYNLKIGGNKITTVGADNIETNGGNKKESSSGTATYSSSSGLTDKGPAGIHKL